MRRVAESSRFDVALLERLYEQQELTVDMLPHTDSEEWLVNNYNAVKGTCFSSREIYVALMTLRKQGRLKPKGRKGRKRKDIAANATSIVS